MGYPDTDSSFILSKSAIKRVFVLNKMAGRVGKLVFEEDYSSKILLKISSISLISRKNSSFSTAPLPLNADKRDPICCIEFSHQKIIVFRISAGEILF